MPERLRENVRPPTHIKEVHANKPADNSLFESQIYENSNRTIHNEKERTVIDKGTTVHETVHHHVHHVIQPVIQKETIEKELIRTTIPIREVSQEAPIVHETQMHHPVAMEHFLKRGGTLKGGVPQTEIGRRVLHSGKCVREIGGHADSPGDMNLSKKDVQGTSTLTTTDTGLEYHNGGSYKRGAQPSTSSDQANFVSARN